MREKNVIESGKIKFFASLMKPNLKTWLGIFLLIASVALFSACAPTGDDPEPATPPVTTTPTEPAEPTEPTDADRIAAAVRDAMSSSEAADTAASDAMKAVEEAKKAGEDLATHQTNREKTYDDPVEKAQMAYELAKEEAGKAKAALDKATKATDLTDVIKAAVEAENAQKAAETALGNAMKYGSEAIKAAGDLLKFDDDLISYGDTSVDSSNTDKITDITDSKRITGLLKKLTTPGKGIPVGTEPGEAKAFVPDDLTTPDVNEHRPYIQAVQGKDLNIGSEFDSQDDEVRVRLITHYADTKNVYVFAYLDAQIADDIDTSALAVGTNIYGRAEGEVIVVEGATDAEDQANDLKSEGEYYLAGIDIETADTTGLVHSKIVGANAGFKKVFSYKNASDVTVYVVLAKVVRDVLTADTYYIYRTVDIHAPAAPDGTDTGTNPDEVKITAEIPDAKKYNHIEFGIWAGLGKPNSLGNQDITDMGIGFLHNANNSQTEVMPNHKDAKYEGNWVATVRGRSDGPIELRQGTATLTADFSKDDIEVDLVSLAELSGIIFSSTFSGTTIEKIYEDAQLGPDKSEFDGEFSGAFYGEDAEEAGGIFNFSSDDSGDFRGAFGGSVQ